MGKEKGKVGVDRIGEIEWRKGKGREGRKNGEGKERKGEGGKGEKGDEKGWKDNRVRIGPRQ